MLLQFCIALSAFVPTARAAGNVEILSNTGYVDTAGNYYVVGEVQNIGGQTVNFIQVTATFYDSQNSIVDSRFDLTMLNVLLEQRKTPFKIALLDVAESSRVDHYTLQVTYLETDPVPMRLVIQSYSNSSDYDGSMRIVGTLKNLGDEKLVNAKIVATYYDASSHVVAAELTSFDPEVTGDINPGQTVSFEIRIGKERAQYVKDYILAAESNQYEMVPELQPQMIAALLSVLALITAVYLRPGRLTTAEQTN